MKYQKLYIDEQNTNNFIREEKLLLEKIMDEQIRNFKEKLN